MTHTKKPPAASIPKVNWTENMVWKLLKEIKCNKNWIVLLGKWKKGEVCYDISYCTHTTSYSAWAQKTSGNSKVTIYQRMAAVVLLDHLAINAIAAREHVKQKYEG